MSPCSPCVKIVPSLPVYLTSHHQRGFNPVHNAECEVEIYFIFECDLCPSALLIFFHEGTYSKYIVSIPLPVGFQFQMSKNLPTLTVVGLVVVGQRKELASRSQLDGSRIKLEK